MSKRWISLSYRRQRAILTDVLPFEVPPTFSNSGFFRFLIDHEVEIQNDELIWIEGKKDITVLMSLLFDTDSRTSIEPFSEWGRNGNRVRLKLDRKNMGTIPFDFRVSHKLEGRLLSIVHPRNQLDVANFYSKYSPLIIYYSSVSEFSIRRPVSVSRFSYFNDNLHKQLLADSVGGIEEAGKEYEQLGSFFTYKNFSNIHRFFESYKYHRCEKKYDSMTQIDISKCFDSIYCHSISWAVLGKLPTKLKIPQSTQTFAGKFDSLMQSANFNETNGIVIGPEFSRVFAEIILQSIDRELQDRLEEELELKHRIDYELFRYVDDYFIFYNKEEHLDRIRNVLVDVLKNKKLSLNHSKEKKYHKPIITEITVAKEKITSLLDLEISPQVLKYQSEITNDEMIAELHCPIDSNRLIKRFKVIIKETGVDYSDLLNFTFAIVEKKLEKLERAFESSAGLAADIRRAGYALIGILEFAFFAYAASPKVNHTIRICRIFCVAKGFLSRISAPEELKHIILKFAHDNIFQLLEKNKSSQFREIENLYLLTTLLEAGPEYYLPESVLASYFQIKFSASKSDFERSGFLSYFSITVLLMYIKRERKYQKLRSFLEEHCIEKLRSSERVARRDTESILLFLDLVCCPYIGTSTKVELAKIMKLNKLQLNKIATINREWFTTWGAKFNLLMALDAKRSREVY